MTKTTKWALIILPIYISFIFLQSLFFKFMAAAEPIHIFSTLDQWTRDDFGIGGLFYPSGLGAIFGGAVFNATAVGVAELVVSIALLAGFAPGRGRIQGIAGLAASAVMSGAIFFHLFTPLGVEIVIDGETDGGLLFFNAVGIWIAGLIVAYFRLARGLTAAAPAST